MDRVFTILVCYNTPYDRLEEIIENILNQSYPVEKLLIWDNASDNDLDKLLEGKHYLNDKRIIYYKSEENLGAGGGFAAGLNYIEKLSLDYDWIWFIEDDVAPEIDCLENLLKYKNISKFLCPRIKIDNKIVSNDWIFDFRLLTILDSNNLNFENKEFTFITFHTFEGILIHKDLLKKIGYPPSENFIGYDDVIFTFNASLFENLILVKNSYLLVKKNKNYYSPKQLYYSTRNLWLLIDSLKRKKIFKYKWFPFAFLLYIFNLIRWSIVCFKHTKSLKSFTYPLIGFIHFFFKKSGKYF